METPAGPSGVGRSVASVADSIRTLEGGGFPVRRPFPTSRLPHVDPFLLLDEMGPVLWRPGEALGAPDHPHRGFETVTYVLSGRMEHRDSAGHHGVIGPGDVQWMTAGAGVVHSELPERGFLRSGGTMHGFQLWVNLPARDKMMRPRYQDVPRDRIPFARTPDGLAEVRVVAGRALGAEAAIETRTPISYFHFTLRPGAEVAVDLPPDQAAIAYPFAGDAVVGAAGALVGEGRLAMVDGDGSLRLASAPGARQAADLLVLAGVPIGEPIARHGPFVMNTPEEIARAIEDYRSGRFGRT